MATSINFNLYNKLLLNVLDRIYSIRPALYKKE